MFSLPPEKAHRLAFPACRLAAALTRQARFDSRLATSIGGLVFRNPVGLAAGFDKNAEAPRSLLKLGFGFVEVGTLTPLPQVGNPPPRLFRLASDQALINRLGFPNCGYGEALAHLHSIGTKGTTGPIGINIGPNRDSKNPVIDYLEGLTTFAKVASYFTLNVSSPNTPGLRDLQLKKNLDEFLQQVSKTRKKHNMQSPIFLKISPDVSRDELKNIVHLASVHNLTGLIVANTTLSRPSSLQSVHKDQKGGLSGKPLLALSTDVLKEAYRYAERKLILIGTGGITSGQDAFQKILSGASLIQFYTAMVYEGPGHIRRILSELRCALEKENFSTVSEAVGKGV